MRMPCRWCDWDNQTRPLPTGRRPARFYAVPVPEGWTIFAPYVWALWVVLTAAGVLLFPALTPGQSILPPRPDQAAKPAKPAETLFSFDPNTLSLRTAGTRFQLWAGDRLVKDLGGARHEAEEAFRVVRDLRASVYGTIPGSQPAFEYWLVEGFTTEPSAPRPEGTVRQIVPFDLRTLRVEQVAGVWCVRDDGRVIYNFGHDADAAHLALAVCRKYSFNQLGVVGTPNPVLTCLLADPSPGARLQAAPNPIELQNSIAQLGLILPKVGYVGTRAPIQTRKLDLVRDHANWLLTHGGDVLASFSEEREARTAQRALQDWRVNELAKVGPAGFKIFLANGMAPRGVPLGVTGLHFQPPQVRAQQSGGTWWLVEGGRLLLDCGESQEQAELMARVIQFLGCDQLLRLGHPLKHDGLQLLIRGR